MPSIKTPDFKLNIGGIDFTSDKKLREMVNEIEIEMVSDGASSFVVRLDDRDGSFSGGKDGHKIVEGMSCEIELGFEGSGPGKGTAKLFEGIVTGVKTERKEYQRTVFTVTGFDGLQSLTRGRKRRSWEEVKDSCLATQIANENGLQPDVEDSGIIHPYVVQNNENDLSFLFERAKRIGFEVKVEDKRLVFKKPKRTEDLPITLSWRGPDEQPGSVYLLQRCDFNTSTMNVVKKVVVRSYCPKSSKEIIGTACSIDGGSMGGEKDAGEYAAANNPDTTIQISDQPVTCAEEAEKLAQSILNDRAANYMTGHGRCEGCNKMKCGKKVTIKEVGSQYEGDYYITSAKHSFKVGHSHGFGYWTDFTVSRTGH